MLADLTAVAMVAVTAVHSAGALAPYWVWMLVDEMAELLGARRGYEKAAKKEFLWDFGTALEKVQKRVAY